MKLSRAGWLLLWAGFVLVSGAAEKVKILTTFPPAYCFAVNIAGSNAEITNLLPGHASLHDYNLTPADLRKLYSADILVMNGAGLETWFEKALKQARTRSDLTIVRLADGLEKELIPLDERKGGRHSHGEVNPHIWLDPVLAARGVRNIAKTLQVKDPAHASVYEKNAEAFLARLRRLDDEYKTQTAPIQNKAFLTYHNAFAYLARRYHLNLAGVVEKIPEVAPSARERSELDRLIKEKNVRALFTEPGAPNRLARQIASDNQIELAELDPFEAGELSAEAYEKVMMGDLGILVRTLKK